MHLERTQVNKRGKYIPLFGRIMLDIFPFILQQQGEYKQSGIKIITLYSRFVCTFHLCSLLVLQLCEFVLAMFFFLMLVDGRTLRLVRKEVKARRECRKLSLIFFDPFLYLCTYREESRRQTKCNI